MSPLSWLSLAIPTTTSRPDLERTSSQTTWTTQLDDILNMKTKESNLPCFAKLAEISLFETSLHSWVSPHKIAFEKHQTIAQTLKEWHRDENIRRRYPKEVSSCSPLEPDLSSLSQKSICEYLELTPDSIPEELKISNDDFLKLNDLQLERILNPWIEEKKGAYQLHDNTSRKIRESYTSNERRLDLRNLGLESLPRAIRFCLPTSINLSGNKLTKFPEDIISPHLCSLDISHNQIKTIPPEIQNLTTLEDLFLNGNQLSSIPEEIRCLPINHLDLSRNRFTKFPQAVTKLYHLCLLDISHNKIEELPPEISKLKNLIKFQATDNKLRSVPDSFHEMTNLTTMFLDNNEFEIIPPRMARPPGIRSVGLSHNQIRKLPTPASMEDLTKLSHFNLAYNQLPRKILARIPTNSSWFVSGNRTPSDSFDPEEFDQPGIKTPCSFDEKQSTPSSPKAGVVCNV